MASAVSLLKGEKKKLRRKEKRARIEQIRITLGLSDSQRTPMVIFIISSMIYSNILYKVSLALWHHY